MSAHTTAVLHGIIRCIRLSFLFVLLLICILSPLLIPPPHSLTAPTHCPPSELLSYHMHGSRVSCLSLLSCLANTSSSPTHLATAQYHISISEYLSLDVLCLIYVYHAYIPTYILSPARVDGTAAIPSVPPSFAYVGDYSNHGCKRAVCSDTPVYIKGCQARRRSAFLGAALPCE